MAATGDYDRKLFNRVNLEGLEILLPKSFKIDKSLGQPLYAKERGGGTLEITHNLAERMEPLLKAPLEKTQAYLCRIIREAEINDPCTGYERITESKFLRNGKPYFGWQCVLKPRNAAALWFDLSLDERFAEREAIWTTMFKSIRVNASKASSADQSRPGIDTKSQAELAKEFGRQLGRDPELAKRLLQADLANPRQSALRNFIEKVVLKADAPITGDVPHVGIAKKFVEHLVAEEFDAAHALLTPELKQQIPPQKLADDLAAMINYGDGPVKDHEVMNTMEDWPGKQDGDVGWVYTALAGDGFSDAVTVVVCKVSNEYLIREIQWGRP